MASNPRLIDLQQFDFSGSRESKLYAGSEVTLRDLFAAFCAAGLNANPAKDYDSWDLVALALEQADSFLAQREPPDAP